MIKFFVKLLNFNNDVQFFSYNYEEVLFEAKIVKKWKVGFFRTGKYSKKMKLLVMFLFVGIGML